MRRGQRCASFPAYIESEASQWLLYVEGKLENSERGDTLASGPESGDNAQSGDDADDEIRDDSEEEDEEVRGEEDL